MTAEQQERRQAWLEQWRAKRGHPRARMPGHGGPWPRKAARLDDDFPAKPAPAPVTWTLPELVAAGWSSRSIAAVLGIPLAEARAARG